jgi:uncharacterized protein YjbI with pentapeptide repeats
MYKHYKSKTNSEFIVRLSDNAFIPLDLANTDYANFKKDILEGAELQDAEGNTMTTEEVTEFIATLP